MEFSDWFKLKKKHYRWLTMASHEITLVAHTDGQRFNITDCSMERPGGKVEKL